MHERTFVGWALLMFLAVACAGGNALKRGERMREAGKLQEAIIAYEEVLQAEPDNMKAREGVRLVRRAQAGAQLKRAQNALSRGEYAKALGESMRARRMPLALEDDDVARQIDKAVQQSAQLAEERVHEWVERGHFIPAIELADSIVKASPGVKSRQEWAIGIRRQAKEHYSRLAAELTELGLWGSSAVAMSFAKDLGVDVAHADIASAWNRFSKPVCFGEPVVTVSLPSESDVATTLPLKAEIEAAIAEELHLLRRDCGDGVRPLELSVTVSKLAVTDQTREETHARPLPGSRVETEETYVEEIPYTEVQEYTELEERTEKIDRRDCAPRPGQKGCREWTEEKVVKIPVVKTREVQRVRQVKRKRPKKGPFPPDSVLEYLVTLVDRGIELEGEAVVAGAGVNKTLAVAIRSRDVGNEEARSGRMLIKADPLEAKPMSAVIEETAAQVGKRVRGAVVEAVTDWSRAFATSAREETLKGRFPEAEELYLRVIALGAKRDLYLPRFFQERYGRGVDEVLASLTRGIGRGTGEPSDTTPKSRETQSSTALEGEPPEMVEGASEITPDVAVDGKEDGT